MKIDSDLIRAEREKRAWSQEHLAAAAGIGLRTIQRVESDGIASNETAKSLAAVFECSLNDLRVSVLDPKPLWKRPLLVGSTVIAGFILGIALITSRTQAKEIMLNVVFTSSAKDLSTFKMLTTSGKETEALLDKDARLVFVPTLKDNDLILVAVDIYGYDGKDFKLVSHPKVLIRNGREARVQVGADDGKVYDIKIRPQTL